MLYTINVVQGVKCSEIVVKTEYSRRTALYVCRFKSSNKNDVGESYSTAPFSNSSSPLCHGLDDFHMIKLLYLSMLGKTYN